MINLSEHDISGFDCWCSPDFYLPCDCDEGCFKCDGGKIPITRSQADEADGGVMVVHHGVVDEDAG